MAELEARIRAALRRRQAPGDDAPATLEVGPLVLDLVRHEARLDGSPVELTAKEFDLVAFLARHRDKLCTHQMILNAVWGTGYATEVQYLHAYIHRLRHKLGEGSGVRIKTTPGIGYVLTFDAVRTDD